MSPPVDFVSLTDGRVTELSNLGRGGGGGGAEPLVGTRLTGRVPLAEEDDDDEDDDWI